MRGEGKTLLRVPFIGMVQNAAAPAIRPEVRNSSGTVARL